MKLNTFGFALSCALTWAGYTALLYLGCRFFDYGKPFIHILNSIYLGAHATIKGSILATAWALVDGFIGGYIFAYIYNIFASEK